MRNAIQYVCCGTLLLLCSVAFSAHTVRAQQCGAAASPAVSPKPPASSAAPSGSPPDHALSPLDINAHGTEHTVDASIPNDPAVDMMLAPYSLKVRELDKVIGRLESNLSKDGMGGGSLGNFVADALRDRAQKKLGRPIMLAVTNNGGLRKSALAAGDITSSHIYQLLPFENALVTLDLNGEQLRRFLQLIVERRDAQSGARITYRVNAEKKNEIVSIHLGSAGAGKEINPKATYTILTSDYLVKRGGDYSVLQEAKNIQELGLTIRDAVLDYVKALTAARQPVKVMLDGRFRHEGNDSLKTPDKERR